MIGWLVAARGCQAIGAAALLSNAPALLTRAFPDQQRGRVLALQGTAITLGLIIGPSAGGLLAATFGWGSVLLINVAIGSVALLLSWRCLPRDLLQSSTRERFDLPGAAALSIGLVALILGVNQASNWGWTSPLLWGCSAAAFACLAVFVWIEHRTSAPVLDLKLFGNTQFSTTLGAATLNYAAGFAMQFVPVRSDPGARLLAGRSGAGLQRGSAGHGGSGAAERSVIGSDRHPSARSTGSSHRDDRGALADDRWRGDTHAHHRWVVSRSGSRPGSVSSPTISAVLGAAPRERRGVASGVMSTARALGMVVGFAVGGAIFNAGLGTVGLAATPIAIAEAADTTILLSAVLMVLATVVLVCQFRTGYGALTSWTRRCIAQIS